MTFVCRVEDTSSFLYLQHESFCSSALPDTINSLLAGLAVIAAIRPTAMCSAAPLQGPVLHQIVLPEDKLCPKPDSNGHCHCTIRTGGDKLRVILEILGPCNQGFTAEVRLEGMLTSRCHLQAVPSNDYRHMHDIWISKLDMHAS